MVVPVIENSKPKNATIWKAINIIILILLATQVTLSTRSQLAIKEMQGNRWTSGDQADYIERTGDKRENDLRRIAAIEERVARVEATLFPPE
jgi:hypothetical protein